MNVRSPLLFAALLATASTPAFAAFESIKIKSDNELPYFPPTLIAEGITRGFAVVAVSVNLDGRVDDWLVLGYSHERLARCTVDALKEWRMIPAKLDGQPVRALTELRFDFTAEGAVITSNITERFLNDMFDRMGERRFAYRVCPPSELDRTPAKVAGDAPHYAADAERADVRGRVAVHFYINEKGEVRMPSVHVGSHPYLMEQAVEALKSWKFEPPTRRGQPVLVAAAQEFDFGGGK